MNAAINSPSRAHAQALNLQLPWSSSFDIDYNFKRILQAMLVVFAVIAVAVPFVPVPEIPRAEQETLPPVLAQVVLEEKKLPPKKEPPKPKPKPKPEPKKKPKPKPAPEPKPEPVNPLEEARKAAASSGVLQFQDDLAAMRDNLDMAQLNNKDLSRGAAAARQVKRDLITSQASGTSGGISTANFSADVGGRALSGRETTRVQSDLASRTKSGKRTGRNNRGLAGRNEEELRKVVDRNRGVIDRLYQRALRIDSSLEGRVSVKMTIEPDGHVSNVVLVNSELSMPSLEQKILARLKLLNFGKAEVSRMTIGYDFDFFPA